MMDKPRERALSIKDESGDITPEEKGEMYGLRVFPNNPRGQELTKKEFVGATLSEEEQEELRRLRQLKVRQEEMTPDQQRLWERIENKDPNVVEVSMNQGKAIEVSLDDEDEKIIMTHSLGGCFGTLVFSEDETGHRSAVMTHFDPTSISKNMEELRRLIGSSPKMKASGHMQALILAAEGVELNSQTKQWERKVDDQQGVDMITVAIRAELGNDIDVQTELYSAQQSAMEKDYGLFLVRIPPKDQATYRTWFSQGILGKSV